MGANPGGQLMQTTEVENFLGFPDGILGPELMDRSMKQVERFGARLVQEDVESLGVQARPFTVKTAKGEYKAETVIIATGAEANWLGLPSEQKLRGKGVSACATCDGFFFKGKDVVVIGGGDSAMEEANFLTRFANTVTIIHRRDEFRASKIMVQRVKDNPKIKFEMSAEVLEVLGENSVTGVKIRRGDGSEITLEVQGYFAAIGHTPSSKNFLSAGIEVNEKGYIKVSNGTNTNIPGVFVCGDVSDPRYRQAISAAGTGCMAALDAEKYLEEQH
jgi:thioredoxin reductase (NADPH)